MIQLATLSAKLVYFTGTAPERILLEDEPVIEHIQQISLKNEM